MTQFCLFFWRAGGEKIEVQTENSLVHCTHECIEPHNSLFVRCFMVKIPRIHQQCPYTAVCRSRSDAALASQTLSQCSSSLGRFLSPGATEKSAPQTAAWHFTQLPPPSFPRKFSLDSTTMSCGRGVEDHQFCHLLEKHILISNIVFENHINMQQL